MQRSSGEIRPLTGIRGVAALWVVSCHWAGPELTGLGRDIALHGYVAVDLFMILSGFVLAMTYAPRMQPQIWSGFGGFVWQRVCRLYPLYALTTLVCLAEDFGRGQGLFAPGSSGALGPLASNLLMTTTTIWDVDAIDGPSWSISVEITLNLFFPLFLLLCLRLSARWAVTMTVLAVVALVATTLLNVGWNDGIPGSLGVLDNRLMYLRCAPEFALGMLCWRWWSSSPWPARFGGTGWMGVCLIAMLLMTPFKSLDLPFVLASCLLVIGLATQRSWLAELFGRGLLHWLGEVSFSLYLWHAAFIPLRDGIAAATGGLGVIASGMLANSVTLALVLVFSGLSYRWFELPARRWLRGVFQSEESGLFALPWR